MLNDENDERPAPAGPPAREDLPELDEAPYEASSRLAAANPPGQGGGAGAHDGGTAASSFAEPAPTSNRSARTTLVAMLLVCALLLAGLFWGTRGSRTTTSTTGPGATTSAPSTPSSTPATSAPTTSATPSQPSAGTNTPGAVPTDVAAGLAPFYTQQVGWKSCPDIARHQCATITVPVDYDEPSGDTFTLALRKVPATDPAKRIGSLLINPGGPGGSGLEYAQYASYVFSPTVRAAYDIVGFDPRGIGQSSPVACLTDEDMDRLFESDPTPDTDAERQQLLDDAKEVTQACADRGGERALHMSTAEVARDMDIIRGLVGDPKLNYLGVSYGTFLGALYAEQFPQRVGRLVLDSAISPNQTDAQEMTYDVQGFESSFEAFATWCAAQDECALGDDPAAAPDKLVALLDEVERTGLRTNKPGFATIGEGWVSFAIFMCLYSDRDWPTLNKGLTEALQGRGDSLLTKAFQVVSRSNDGSYDAGTYLHAMIPVRCADWPTLGDDVQAERDRLGQAHPLWSRMTGMLYDMCAGWPGEARQPTGTAVGSGAAPILVIGNLRDPATPIGGTEQLAEDLESGVLVTVDHDGHGAYFSGNTCADTVVDDYLVDGTVPPDGKTC